MRTALKALVALLLAPVLVACVSHLANSGDDPLPPRPDAALRAATLNVHYILARRAEGPWSVGDWMERREPLDAQFKAIGADLFAFQEMETFAGGAMSAENLALDWLLANNPDYRAAAVGDPAAFPSTQPILYRADRLTLVDQGWFFFSDTPDVIYSRTFDGSYPAFASWARFRGPRGTEFDAVNVHTDFRSGSNRLSSARLIAQRIAPAIAAGRPVILLGDLNAIRGAPVLDILTEAGLTFLPVDGATYHLNRGLNLFPAIDHIGTANGIRAAGPAVVLRRRFGGEWPSDHYPVIADLLLPVP